ncbi:hypothetical protein Fmac_011684 [Flemingia macrophylla]|uniref:Uncharacterized protein n=1 Tax=Flemingia macrophylla TaxID=520843 RepID=A0ABD1MN45_9FABA
MLSGYAVPPALRRLRHRLNHRHHHVQALTLATLQHNPCDLAMPRFYPCATSSSCCTSSIATPLPLSQPPSLSRSSPNPSDASAQPFLNPYFNNAATVDAALKPGALPSNPAKKKSGGPRKYSLMTTLLWASPQVRPLQGGANFVAPSYTKGDGLGAKIVGIFILVYMFSHYAMDFLDCYCLVKSCDTDRHIPSKFLNLEASIRRTIQFITSWLMTV